MSRVLESIVGALVSVRFHIVCRYSGIFEEGERKNGGKPFER